MTGGSPGRTYVSGETRSAVSPRSAEPPSHASVNEPDGPGVRSIRSTTSVIPYQLMIAATRSSSVEVVPVDHERRLFPGH